MQARRILLFFGIVLLLTMVAASLMPVPTEPPGEGTNGAPAEGGDQPPAAPGDDITSIRFDKDGEPSTETVEPNTQVVVTVAAPEPGEVELEGLGQIDNAAPRSPAVFDVFTDRPGRYEVVFTPVEKDSERLGTLVVEPDGPPAGAYLIAS